MSLGDGSPPPPLPPFWDPVAGPPPITPEVVRPDVVEVAALEQTRTVDANTGLELGQFTEMTRPTAAEVEDLLDTASADVLSQLPPNIDPIWWPAIRRAIALRVSWMVEASFYRESASSGQGAATEYGLRFAADLAALAGLIPKATYLA